jgi:hypothetical protein
MKLLDKVLALKHGDKIVHFVGGVGVGVLAILAGFPQFATAAALAVGAGKEVYDKVSKKGTMDILDFVATGAGGALAQLWFFLTWPSA